MARRGSRENDLAANASTRQDGEDENLSLLTPEHEEDDDLPWFVPGSWLISLGIVTVALLAFIGWAWAAGQSFPEFWEEDEAAASVGTAADLAALTNPPNHEHADFAIFINGERLSLDEPRFLESEDNELDPEVHMHAPRPTVVHKHRENVTWGRFFDSIGMTLSDSCLETADGENYCSEGSNSLKFFINGVKVDSLANTKLRDLDRILISYGGEETAALEEQIDAVSDQACILSKQCEDRVDPNEPPEACRTGGVCN